MAIAIQEDETADFHRAEMYYERALAIEADKTILIDEPDTIRQADEAGIAIVAR